MLKLDFIDKALRHFVYNFPSHFVYNYSKKMFLVLYLINWTNLILWLSVRLKIFGNMYIVIICFSVCDVINFEINIGFVIKPFYYMTKKFRTKTWMSLAQKEFFRWNEKHFSLFLKGISVARNCLRECTLKDHRWFFVSYVNFFRTSPGEYFWKHLETKKYCFLNQR